MRNSLQKGYGSCMAFHLPSSVLLARLATLYAGYNWGTERVNKSGATAEAVNVQVLVDASSALEPNAICKKYCLFALISTSAIDFPASAGLMFVGTPRKLKTQGSNSPMGLKSGHGLGDKTPFP